ncbi:MAG: hypothetical protein P4L63_01480 [Candidatus Pacebacteria bacterium]|nr:hypothetical protein [Candidatus Paceibacterota bacterium]
MSKLQTEKSFAEASLPEEQPALRPKCSLPIVISIFGDEGDGAVSSAMQRRKNFRALLVAFTQHFDGVTVEELAEEKGEKF